jgi:hypothetical protein
MTVILPSSFGQKHERVLTIYLAGKPLATAAWRTLYEAVDLLSQAQVSRQSGLQTFRQLYDAYVDQQLADKYITRLLALSDIKLQSPKLTAVFAQQVQPILEQNGLLRKGDPQSWLLWAYCLYWWQSFARGYAFEVEIMRDLTASNISFDMHDIGNRTERYSPADLIVLGLLGDIKTSTYFLQFPSRGNLPNDFYITRLYAKGKEMTLVVFQKPTAWQTVGGGTAVSGKLEAVINLLPQPVQLKKFDTTLIVVDYEMWKQMVLQVQVNRGG